jgi:hypothetical protein
MSIINFTPVKAILGGIFIGLAVIGLCPGPAISSIAHLDIHSITFVIAIFVGFYLVKLINIDN